LRYSRGERTLAYQGITYTTREKIIDLGPLKASVDKERRIPPPPIVGVLALAGGVVLVIVGARTRGDGSWRRPWMHSKPFAPPPAFHVLAPGVALG
jgi:hypothetical protein